MTSPSASLVLMGTPLCNLSLYSFNCPWLWERRPINVSSKDISLSLVSPFASIKAPRITWYGCPLWLFCALKRFPKACWGYSLLPASLHSPVELCTSQGEGQRSYGHTPRSPVQMVPWNRCGIHSNTPRCLVRWTQFSGEEARGLGG